MNQNNKERFRQLLENYQQNTIDAEEEQELFNMLLLKEYDPILENTVKEVLEAHQATGISLSPAQIDSMVKTITATQPNVRSIPVFRRAWFRYAAAIIILSGIGTYFFAVNKKVSKETTTAVSGKHQQTDIAPGGNKATLTLSNGTVIVLDTAANGRLAQQGKVQIRKLTHGEIAYDAKGVADAKKEMNTMRTPRGGQYQLTLPDGTKVWLNAASSITYPIAFTGSERTVTVTGEAYFEVAHDASKPFLVKTNNAVVQVLGTHFNIHAYAEEPAFHTTLLEGSVSVKQGNSPSQEVVLKPGQQAILFHDQSVPAPLHVQTADLERVMAWKNGMFQFTTMDLSSIIRQLNRWYDVDIIYEGKQPDKRVTGYIRRDVPISKVLEMLEYTSAIRYTIKDRKVVLQ